MKVSVIDQQRHRVAHSANYLMFLFALPDVLLGKPLGQPTSEGHASADVVSGWRLILGPVAKCNPIRYNVHVRM